MDVQCFERGGTWVKPTGAREVVVFLRGGGIGGETLERSFAADELPDTMDVEVGAAPRGADVQPPGYAVVITHLQ